MFQKHLVYSTEYRNLKKSQAYATKAESEFEFFFHSKADESMLVLTCKPVPVHYTPGW